MGLLNDDIYSLNIAIMYNSVDVAKLLIKYDPKNSSRPITSNIAPIENAVRYNSTEIMELLIKANLTKSKKSNELNVRSCDKRGKARNIQNALLDAHYGLTEEEKEREKKGREKWKKLLYDYPKLWYNNFFLFYFGYSDMLYLDTYIPFIDNLLERYNDMIIMLDDLDDRECQKKIETL